MRCLSNIAAHETSVGTSVKVSNKVRLAALRKAVEGLQALPGRSLAKGACTRLELHFGSNLGPDLDPEEHCSWKGSRADWGLPADLAWGALNEVTAGHADRPAAFGFLLALTALGLKARAGPAVLVAARRALADFGAPYGHGLV